MRKLTLKKINLYSLYLLIFAIVSVILVYYYFDIPIAEYMHIHFYNIKYRYILRLGSKLIVLYYNLIPIIFIIFFILYIKYNKKLYHFMWVMIIMGLNLLYTIVIKVQLKVLFGRYWPSTWSQNNLSWLTHKVYGFNIFHSGVQYESFPSGHATGIFALMSILWIIYPKWRCFAFINCFLTVSCLLILNHHYLGDIISGAILGTITGMYASFIFQQLEPCLQYYDKIKK